MHNALRDFDCVKRVLPTIRAYAGSCDMAKECKRGLLHRRAASEDVYTPVSETSKPVEPDALANASLGCCLRSICQQT